MLVDFLNRSCSASFEILGALPFGIIMGHSVPRDRDFEVDLEKGGAYKEEELSKNTVSGAKKQSKKLFAKLCSGFEDGQIKGDNEVRLCSTTFNGVSMEVVKEATYMKVKGAENVNSAEQKTDREKRKKTGNKKPPKPPRPPKGPSLDAADKKLIREITELAMLKRARIERMKALKKIKAMKTPSSNSNLFSMVFTVIFFLVILFQGFSSRTSRPSVSLAGGLQDGLASAQYYLNPSPNDLPASGSPRVVEELAGSDPQQTRRRRFIR